MSSSFGKIFTLTTFGESHGAGIGGVLDACPAGVEMDMAFIQNELDKRKPGTKLAQLAGTNRSEPDEIKILSGVYEGKTTGTPLAFFVENTNQHSADYNELANTFRPGHADITYSAKYGIRDPRGGGRASARETTARVAGGAIAQLFLKTLGVEIYAYPIAIDGIFATDYAPIDVECDDKSIEPKNYARLFYAPNDAVIPHWEKRIAEVKNAQDTLGGLVRIVVRHAPCGLGEPVFDKLDARLASAIMGVGAVKGVEIGDGFLCATSRGSKNNDAMRMSDTGDFSFESNHAGGILGGISNGEDIIITAAIKPIPSISLTQKTVTQNGDNKDLIIGGRHDVSAIPRNVPVLANMVALTIADMVLLQRCQKNSSSDTLNITAINPILEIIQNKQKGSK